MKIRSASRDEVLTRMESFSQACRWVWRFAILACVLLVKCPVAEGVQGQTPELVVQAGGSLEAASANSVVVGPRNGWIATRDGQGVIRIFDTASQRLSRTLTSSGAASDIAANPLRNELAVVEDPKQPGSAPRLVVYDVVSGKEKWRAVLTGICYKLRYRTNGEELMGLCGVPASNPMKSLGTTELRQWSATDGTLRSSKAVPGATAMFNGMSEQGDLIALTEMHKFNFGKIARPKTDWKTVLKGSAGRPSKTGTEADADDGGLQIQASNPGNFMGTTFVETQTGRTLGHVDGVVQAVSGKARTAVVYDAAGVTLVDVVTGKPIVILGKYGLQDASGYIAIAASPDGTRYVLAGLLRVTVVDAATGAAVKEFTENIPYAMGWAMSPDNAKVVTAQGSTGMVLEVADGRQQALGDPGAVMISGAMVAKAMASEPMNGRSATQRAEERKMQEQQYADIEAKSRGRTKKEYQKQREALAKQDEAARPRVEEEARNKEEAQQGMLNYYGTMGAQTVIPPVSAFMDQGRLLAVRTADGGWGVWDVATGNPLPFHEPLGDIKRYKRMGNALQNLLDAGDLRKIEQELGIAADRDVNLGMMPPPSTGTIACASADRRHWIEIARKDKKLVSAVLHHADGKTADLMATGMDLSSFNLRSSMDAMQMGEDPMLKRSASTHTSDLDPFKEKICSLSPDGSRLIVEGMKPEMKAARKQKIAPLFGNGLTAAMQRGMYGESIYGRSFSDSLVVYNTSDGRRVCELENKDGPVPFEIGAEQMVFSSNHEWVASGDKEANISPMPHGKDPQVWSAETCKQVYTLNGEKGGPFGFSEDGKLLYVRMSEVSLGTQNAGVRVFDTSTGKRLYDLPDALGGLLTITPRGKALIGPDRDNALSIWDRQTGERIGTMRPMQEGEWLVTTPGGLFDGSPRGWKQIAWRDADGLGTQPGEIFFNEFYSPGLLAELLDGHRPKTPRTIAQVDRRQPKVQVAATVAASAQRTVGLRVEVAEAPADAQTKAGGVRDVRLFRNGVMIKAWRGEIELREGRASLGVEAALIHGENHFAAYAFNRDNVKSQDAEVKVQGTEKTRSGTAFVLAIGVNTYSNAEFNLKYAVPDASRLSEVLEQSQRKLGNYQQVVPVALLDGEATKANVLLALDRLAGTSHGALPPKTPSQLGRLRAVQPEDAVVIYFAGHGVAWGDHFYLVPHDLGFAGPRAELRGSLDGVLHHSVSDVDLEQRFEPMDAGQILLIIDACNSGKALDAEEQRRGPMNNKGLAQLAYEKGIYVLTAAQAFQSALESSKLGHGYLTYALAEEALTSAVADSTPVDGKVTAVEWFDYASRRVPQLQIRAMEETGGRQLTFESPSATTATAMNGGRLQTPRFYYRRDPLRQEMIIANVP